MDYYYYHYRTSESLVDCGTAAAHASGTKNFSDGRAQRNGEENGETQPGLIHPIWGISVAPTANQRARVITIRPSVIPFLVTHHSFPQP